MLRKTWEKRVNYETVSYLICGVLTTAVDFVVYTVSRDVNVEAGVSQVLSWLVTVLFTYVVNKLIVSHDYNIRSSYLVRGVGTFVAARAFSGVVTWALVVVVVRLGGDKGFIYELFRRFTSSVINMVLNYVFNRLWIFKKE